jgi:hypothetical protein
VPASQWAVKLITWAGFLPAQFGWIGLVLGLMGLLALRFKPAAPYLVTGWIFVAFTIFSLGYNTTDAEVYLIPAILVFSIWVGCGSAWAMEWLSRSRRWLGLAFGIGLTAVFAGLGAMNFSKVDASGDRGAELYGLAVMAALPANALVFTSMDRDTFTMWYFQYVLHQREDVAVISKPFLPYQWYRDTLKFTYPTLAIPDRPGGIWQDAVAAANSARPDCETLSIGQDFMFCH